MGYEQTNSDEGQNFSQLKSHSTGAFEKKCTFSIRIYVLVRKKKVDFS